MNVDVQNSSSTTGQMPLDAADAWRKCIIWGTVALASAVLLHAETALRAVDLWSSSSAYNYAFLIIPISAYLVWEERARLAVMVPSPSPLGLVVVFLFSVSWLIADAIGINEGRQLSLVGIFQGILLTVLGVRVFRLLLFPITYLWLLVPTGEFLVPTLQKVATAGSVWMLDLTGIPQYTEGFLIQTPTGNFLVEPGCAGLNFILSSLALSLLYGKLTYRRWRTRLICIFTALVLSVVANIVRIYLIIAITQFTDRKLNIADDHILYGWGFFAVIMLVTMWFGLKFEDKEVHTEAAVKSVQRPHEKAGAPVFMLVLAVLLMIGAPVAIKSVIATTYANHLVSAQLPDQVGQWRGQPYEGNWQPVTVADQYSYAKSYSKDGEKIDLFLSYFPYQTDAFEPAAFSNQPADMTLWSVMTRRLITMPSVKKPVPVQFFSLRSPSETRHAAVTVLSGNCVTASRLMSRICGAPGRYGLGESSGAYFVVSTQGGERTDARKVLASFMSEIHPADFIAAYISDEQGSAAASVQTD